MNRRKMVPVCGIALLLAAAVGVVVASRNRQQSAPPTEVPVVQTPAEVRVKAVERKPEPILNARFYFLTRNGIVERAFH